MNWSQVFRVHRRIGAVYFSGGALKSVLFSVDRRRSRLNFRQGDRLCLCFDEGGSTSEIRQLKSTLKVGDRFVVYEKLAPDAWRDAGVHQCVGMGRGIDANGRDSIVVSMLPVSG